MVGGDCFLIDANGFNFASGGEDFSYGGVEFDVDVGILEVGVEDSGDIFCGLVDGEYSAIFAGVDVESSLGEHIDDVGVGVAEAGWADEISFVFSECFEDGIDGAVVGDVAFASAGDEDFCADAVGFFEKQDSCAIGCGFIAGEDSRRSGTDNNNWRLHMRDNTGVDCVGRGILLAL